VEQNVYAGDWDLSPDELAAVAAVLNAVD